MTLRIVLLAVIPLVAAEAAAAVLQRDFTNGPVVTQIRLDPANPLIGDDVTLTITVTAEEGVEVFMPAFGDALDTFNIVSFVPRESLDRQGRSIRSQIYQLQIPRSGKQAIPPILVEYVDRRPGQRAAPEGLDAYELLTERIDFEVRSVLPDDVQAELEPPLGQLQPLAARRPARWPWLVGAALVALAAVPWMWRWWYGWRKRARRRTAYEIAKVRLERLLHSGMPTTSAVGPFFVDLSQIVRRYLEDRFELRAPELTTEEFLASVGKSPDLSRDHQALLREFLRQADLVKFAGVHPSQDDIQHSIAAARRFLEETRENAPLLEADADHRSAAQDVEADPRGEATPCLVLNSETRGFCWRRCWPRSCSCFPRASGRPFAIPPWPSSIRRPNRCAAD